MEIINIYKKSGINTSSKMLQLLVNSWCQNIKYSTIDLAMILDEIGVEKFLPGSSELLSGTLSLLHESLTKCSTRCSCSSPAILSKTLARDLTLFFGLHHSNNPKHFNSNFGVVFVFWDKFFGTYLGPDQIKNIKKYGLPNSQYNKFHPLYAYFLLPFIKIKKRLLKYV